MDPDSQHTVLVVDDEEDVADLYGTWLQDDCTVRTAYDGERALELLDERVDVVLLDRRMPTLSGDEVLGEIRQREFDCRVVMVTAVKPDFDIVEMGFDDYLVKPVSKDDVRGIVEDVLARTEYDEQLRSFYALASKKAVLETEKEESELESSDEYRELADRVEDLREDVDETRSDLTDHEEFARAFEDLT